MPSKLLNLGEIYNSKGREFSLGLLDKFLIIKEKTLGTYIKCAKTPEGFLFYKKASHKPLTILDRTLQSIYENVIDHMRSLPEELVNDIPNDHQFIFQYIAESQTIILDEIRITNKNNSIQKFIDDKGILENWSNKLNVESSPIIHYGRLNKTQKTIIADWIDKPDKMYEGIKKLFTTGDKISQGFSIKFMDKLNENISAKILNPKSDIKITDEVRKPSDTYAIALQDILEFLQTINMDAFVIKGTDREQKILNLISDIYSKYISKNGSKYIGMEDLDGPDFTKNIPDFNVNLKFVINKNTKSYLQKSQINRELFKLFLGTFTKKRKKTSILIDDNTKNEINKIVNTIRDRVVDKPKNRESVPTFEEYFYDKYQKRALLESNTLEESYILEGVANDLVHKEPGRKPVNIIVGRFQPPTLGHIKVLRKLHAENSLPCVVVQVRSASGKNQVFDEDIITKIWMDITKQYNFIDGIRESTTGFLVPVLNALRTEFEPVLWGTGTDRYKDYQRMIEKYGPECNVLPDFRSFEIKRSGKNISASNAREFILADNEKEFKKITPKAAHKYYKQLRTELLQNK